MQAIILKKNIFDEGNEIITFYTREQGKVRAVARAIKSTKSKLAHGLEQLFHTEVEILPNHKLPLIVGVKPLSTFKNLRQDLQKVYAALFAAELILKSTADEQRNEKLFDDFLALLQHLDQEEHSSSQSSLDSTHLCSDIFALRLLALTGYALTFEQCAICGKDLSSESKIFFSNRKGSFICENDSQKIVDAQRVSLELYQFLRTIDSQDYTEIDENKVAPQPLHAFVDAFATHILERNLNASKYLATLK